MPRRELKIVVPSDDLHQLRSHLNSYSITKIFKLLVSLFLCIGTPCLAQSISNSSPTSLAPCPTEPGTISTVGSSGCIPGTAVQPGTPTPLSFPNSIPNSFPNSYPTNLTPQTPTSSPNIVIAAPTRVVGPLTTQSDFQIFAEDEAGRRLSVYGRNLFDEVPSTFSPMIDAPVPADYVIGPGDQLSIQVWGKIDLNTRVVVDRNGQIFLPRVGTLRVAGLRYEQLEGFLRAAIGNLYKDFQINVSMGHLRTIQIFVLGSARQPGVYTVSSLSTLVDALFISGGPSANGSMRTIQLRRGGKVVTEFDVYDLLRNGDNSHDAQLFPGDIIYIPPAGPQVAIIGSVNDPGIYELKSGEEVGSVLADAGGLTSLAGTARVLLERIDDHKLRHVDSFPLDASGLQRNLEGGDVLHVFPISPRFDNAVTVRGNVAQPGRYKWREGMRISDVIPSRNFLLTRNYWNQQNYLTPQQPHNPFAPPGYRRNWQATQNPGAGYSLKSGSGPGDQLNPAYAVPENENLNNQTPAHELYAGSLMDQQDPTDITNRWNDRNQSAQSYQQYELQRDGQSEPRGTAERGEISSRGTFSIDQARNGGEINWNYAAIQRLDPDDLSTRLIAFNLGKAIDDPSSSDNKLLQPGDVITVFSQRDIPLPMDKRAIYVRVEGEVKAPGVYRVNPGETLRDLVKRAGGLTPHSYLYASALTRVSTRLAEEQELKQSAQEMQRELMARYAAAPTLASANSSAQQAQMSQEQTLISQISSIQPTGRVVLDMKPDAHSVDDIPAFPLEDGDSFYIPPVQSTVQVVGAVYNPNAFRYENRKTIRQYLNDAGGATRQADKGRIYLIRADGMVVSSQAHDHFWRTDFEKKVLLPGDAIVVPTKLKTPGGLMQQLPFVTQIISQTALTGAVIGTTY